MNHGPTGAEDTGSPQQAQRLRTGGGFNRAGGFVELLNFDEPKKVTLRRGWVEISYGTWPGPSISIKTIGR